jgi:TPR repeat protein
MTKAFLAVCSAFVCLGGLAAWADTAVTSTAASAKCQVSKPDDVAAPVTPSVAAGTAAARDGNFALASANFRPLAESGDVEAERALGQLLMQNCTGLQDQTAAVRWLSKATDGGDVRAKTLLGIAYMNGDGTAQDDGKAFALFSIGAQTGNAVAERALGYLYLSGRGVAPDRYIGMLWSIKAGEQGDATALGNIANAYLTGAALPQDYDKAAYYISVALLHVTGTEPLQLIQTKAAIARQLSQEDMQDEAKRARDWSPGPESLSRVIRDAAKRRDQKSWNPVVEAGK